MRHSHPSCSDGALSRCSLSCCALPELPCALRAGGRWPGASHNCVMHVRSCLRRGLLKLRQFPRVERELHIPHGPRLWSCVLTRRQSARSGSARSSELKLRAGSRAVRLCTHRTPGSCGDVRQPAALQLDATRPPPRPALPPPLRASLRSAPARDAKARASCDGAVGGFFALWLPLW